MERVARTQASQAELKAADVTSQSNAVLLCKTMTQRISE